MAELEEKATTKGTRKSTRQSKPTAKTATRREQPSGVAKRPKSISFQIRTPPETKLLAERVATDHNIGGRSRLDAEIYKRGLLLTNLLLGAGPDGSYSGQSEPELARQLEPLFDRQYAILDRQGLLSSYVYRVLPPGGAGGLFVQAGSFVRESISQQKPQGQQGSHDEEQSRYLLSEDAQTSLENFADEI